jgi:uncharacterized protein (DUF983 family)
LKEEKMYQKMKQAEQCVDCGKLDTFCGTLWVSGRCGECQAQFEQELEHGPSVTIARVVVVLVGAGFAWVLAAMLSAAQ